MKEPTLKEAAQVLAQTCTTIGHQGILKIMPWHVKRICKEWLELNANRTVQESIKEVHKMQYERDKWKSRAQKMFFIALVTVIMLLIDTFRHHT